MMPPSSPAHPAPDNSNDGFPTRLVTPGAETVIAVVAEPDRMFDAVKVTLKFPTCAQVGVQFSVPAVFEAFPVNVPPAAMADPVAVSVVMASPSGSAAVIAAERSELTVPETLTGAVTTGARATESPTVIVVVAVAVPGVGVALSAADHVTV